MSIHPLFNQEAWSGGFFEVALELGPRSDERLRSALAVLWSHPDLDGCYLDRHRDPSEQSRLPPDLMEDGRHLLGVARLPDGSHVACGSCIIREVDDGSDWLDFYLPMGSLSTATYPVGPFPFDTYTQQSDPWQREVEDWLAQLGLHVARHMTYALGLIGFEVSGQVYASEIASEGIPAKRDIGYLWPAKGKTAYFPRSG
jgi:hypothetical protein